MRCFQHSGALYLEKSDVVIEGESSFRNNSGQGEGEFEHLKTVTGEGSKVGRSEYSRNKPRGNGCNQTVAAIVSKVESMLSRQYF